MNISVDPHFDEFPKSLEEEREFVKSKLNAFTYPSFDKAKHFFSGFGIDWAIYDLRVHVAAKAIYDNFVDVDIIKKIGQDLYVKCGMKGLRGVCVMVCNVAAQQTRSKYITAHLLATIEGAFDGIGEWLC
jgi:hypothetical protein